MAEEKSYPFEIEPPNELIFTGPFVAPVNQALRLTNRSDKRVGFKVKTTAPTRYCVRPNAGLLDPSESASVTIVLNAFEYNESERNKHKFMVQALAVGPEITHEAIRSGTKNLDTIFKSARPEELQDRKLKCTLVPEPGGAAGTRGFGQTASRTNNLPADASNAAGSDEETRRKVEQLERENVRLRRQLASDSAKQAPAASAPSTQSGLRSGTQDTAVASSGGGVVFWLSMALVVALVFVIGAAIGSLYLAPMLD